MSKRPAHKIKGFGERLRECMNDSDLNSTQLAEKLGMERKMIYEYRKNRHVPSAYILMKMCIILKVSADYLLFGEKYD